ncbi:MAG: response regulator transcription factor [Pseudomonadota bacterium]
MATGLNIVVVEDHDDLRETLVELLRSHGHRVVGVDCAEALEDEAGRDLIDLLLLDLNLPGEDGISLAWRMITHQPSVSIIMMTARGELNDRLIGYESGADIYLRKPINSTELLAAIGAITRRRLAALESNMPATDALAIISGVSYTASKDGTSVAISREEIAILTALMRAAGRSLEVWQLLAITSDDDTTSVNALQARMTRLRRKLVSIGLTADCIQARRGQGYYLAVNLIIR